MNPALTVIIALLVFGFLIFIHEFGHYITARIFKVSITEFSIGMGPKLLWYDSKKTGIRYSLAMFPIGGFVAMVGENEESDDPNAFDKKPAWQRFIITAAGATVNIVAGVLAMLILVGMIDIGGTRIGAFRTDEQLTEMGVSDLTVRSSDMLMLEDEITHVNGKRVVLADELSYEIMRNGNEPVTLTVIRGGEEIILEGVTFPILEEEGQEFGAMDFLIYKVDKNIGNFIPIAFRKSVLVMRMCWESVIDLITGRYTLAAVSGPVGISTAIGDAAKQGVASLLNITLLISMNLGFMNLLPIPALDGGRLITILIEMITRKRLPTKVEGIINAVGLIVLLGLSFIIMIKDVVQLII
ncbi:MAG: site-2 protease family protein [Clostridia bacterium]|nr:site-2 protease family protein [Clostridia bacterium]